MLNVWVPNMFGQILVYAFFPKSEDSSLFSKLIILLLENGTFLKQY